MSARSPSSDPDRREAEDDLLRAAHAAAELAYAPYSGRAVGVALLSPGGEVFTSCNVENADPALAACAERAALARAIASGEREFLALAVATSSDEPALPCAACQAAFAEFTDDLWIVAEGRAGPRERTTLSELLSRSDS